MKFAPRELAFARDFSGYQYLSTNNYVLCNYDQKQNKTKRQRQNKVKIQSPDGLSNGYKY